MINCFLQIGLGFAGLLLTILYMVQDYIVDGEFNWRVFMCKHKFVALISALLVVTLAVVINVAPEAASTLKAITTMDITREPHSFLLLGTAIYAAVYSKSRANARSRERKEAKETEAVNSMTVNLDEE